MFRVLFGLPGAGKNFIGSVMREEFGFTFYDADSDIPLEMRQAMAAGQPVSDDMRNQMLQAILNSVAVLRGQHRNLVIAQVFAREKHRQEFLRHHPDAEFVLVIAPQELRSVRLLARQQNTVNVTLDIAQLTAAVFEVPQINHHVIQNAGDRAEIIRQLRNIIK